MMTLAEIEKLLQKFKAKALKNAVYLLCAEEKQTLSKKTAPRSCDREIARESSTPNHG